jgi:hypothetical protein
LSEGLDEIRKKAQALAYAHYNRLLYDTSLLLEFMMATQIYDIEKALEHILINMDHLEKVFGMKKEEVKK